MNRHGELVVMALMAYAGPIDDGEGALAPFRDLATPIADMVGPMPYPELYPPEEEGYHPVASIRTTFVDGIDRQAADTIVERLQTSTAEMGITQLRVLGGAMARVPADATAFAHRSSPIMASAVAIYDRPEERSVHDDWVAGLATELMRDGAGAYVGFIGDEGEERVRAAYPGRTWDRLAAIKGRYDPDNLFRLNQNVPPALH